MPSPIPYCTVDYDCIPSAVFSHPPIAAIGMTEAEARYRLGAVALHPSMAEELVLLK